MDEKELSEFISQLECEALRDVVPKGVGFLHEGLSDRDRRLVHTLFQVSPVRPQSTIVFEGFKGGTRGAPIMPRDVSLSDSKCWNGGQKNAEQ